MLTVMLLGTSGRDVNHSPSAQLWSTALALALPPSALARTSWKASNISKVFFNAWAAMTPTAVSSSSSISGVML